MTTSSKTNRLKEIREWLKKSRVFLANDYPKGKSGEFYLLIAVELLTRYLEVDTNQTKANKKMTKAEVKKAYKKGLADALRIISDGEGWEESRDHYARILKLPTVYDKFEANKSSRK